MAGVRSPTVAAMKASSRLRALFLLPLLALLACLAVSTATAQADSGVMTFVKDVRPGVAGGSVSLLTDIGGTLFFRANDGTNGVELWKSDGSAAGTTQVKDIAPAGNSNPTDLTDVEGTVFFVANDGTNGRELWKSDGTAAGTVMVKNVNGVAASSGIANLTPVNGFLYFTADDGTNGVELWRSDGTTSGTAMVEDINTGGNSNPSSLEPIGSTLYFAADDGTAGVELWRSDGTLAGTTMVTDLFPGPTSSGPDFLTNAGGTLMFAATDGTSGIELWKSDGTALGTTLVKNIRPGSFSSGPEQLIYSGGTLFFDATDGTTGREMWGSDGTGAGTVQLKNIAPGSASSFPISLTAAGGGAYFVANSQTVEGNQLYVSDGTPAGTQLVKDLNPGVADGPENLTEVGGLLFFQSLDPSGLYNVYRSDGTATGTFRLNDPVNGSGTQTNLADLGGTLYAELNDAAHGFELWKGVGFPFSSSPDLTLPSTRAGESSAPQGFGFANFGAAPLDFTDARTIDGDAPDFEIDFDNCTGRRVSVSEDCRLDLVFDPESAGSKNSTLAVTASGIVSETPLTGLALAPADTVLPETAITSGPTGTTGDSTPAFAFTSSEAGTFDCRTDGGAWAACTSPTTLAAQPDGFHTFEVRAVDSASNADPSPASRSFTVDTTPPAGDTTPPDVFFTSGPAGLTNDATPTFGFAMSEAGTLQCRVDGAQFAACSSPKTTPALSQGPHTFEVRGIDAAGNKATVAREILVDTAPPQTTLAAVPKQVKAKKKTAKLSFSFSASEGGSSFQCSIDGAAFTSCTSPLAAKFKKGTHTFAVKSVDKAANADASPATASFKVKAKRKKK